MGFKEIISSLGKKQKNKKALLKAMDEQRQIEKILEEREKSANERELERFIKEEREEKIKEQLEYMRKKRQKDINFGHNPLDTPNITNKVDWEVLKEKNLFNKKGNMFTNQGFIHRNNPKLFKNERWILR